MEDTQWFSPEESCLESHSNIVEDLINAKKRPLISIISSVPDGRASLSRGIKGASESDAVNEEIARQLRLFLPDNPLPLDDAVLVIGNAKWSMIVGATGLLCQLSSNADIGVRTEVGYLLRKTRLKPGYQ